MSVTSTFNSTIYGKTYGDILDTADKTIADFFGIEVSEVSSKVSYELSIRPVSVDGDDDPSMAVGYEADMIARVRGAK